MRPQGDRLASSHPGPEQIAEALDLGLGYTVVGGVVELVPNQQILCSTRFHELDWLRGSHFRGGPAIVPGALLIEAFAQAARLLELLSSESGARGAPDGHGLLAEGRVVFRSKVTLDARPEVLVKLDGSIGRFSSYKCDCLTASGVAAAGRLLACTVPERS